MAAAAAWIRRFSSDHHGEHPSDPRRNSLYTPHNTHGSPLTSSRNNGPPTVRRRGPMNFIAGLYASSRRRFSLPVSSISSGSVSSVSGASGSENIENEHIPHHEGYNKNVSLPDLIEVYKNIYLQNEKLLASIAKYFNREGGGILEFLLIGACTHSN